MGRFFCNKCGREFTEAYAPDKCPFCCSASADFIRVKEDTKQTIPKYWEKELDEKIARIRKLQTEAGPQSASFGLITDIHWCDNAHHQAALLEEILNRCMIPYFFNAGDIISGFGLCDKDFLFEELDNCRAAFKKIESKCLVVLGNHDMAYSTLEAPNYYAENLSHDEVCEYLFRSQTLYSDRVFGPDISCYYVDDVYHKMRYAVLNAHDVPSEEKNEAGLPIFNKFSTNIFSQAQLDWVAESVLDVSDDEWTVTVCTHENPASGEKIGGAKLLLGMLKAFKEHKSFEGCEEISELNVKLFSNVDFTNKGGNVAAWVSGHTHYDKMEIFEGITCVTTLNDSIHKSAKTPFEKFRGTTTEHAFDIFTVDKRCRKVFVTRIGAGEDREFDY